jgi:O-antigen ligase
MPLAIYSTLICKGIKRYYYLLQVLIFVGALELTFTRGAFISVPLSLIVMFLFLPSRKMKAALFRGMALLAILTILLAVLFNFPIFDRFFKEDITTLNGRTYIWNLLLNNFDPLQLQGKGLNASGVLVSTLNMGNGLGGVAAQSHNLFLGTLYDNGIIGLALLIGVFIALGSNLLVNIRKTTDNHHMLYATALASFINMAAQSFETSDILSLHIGIYFWIIVALPFAFCWPISDQ